MALLYNTISSKPIPKLVKAAIMTAKNIQSPSPGTFLIRNMFVWIDGAVAVVAVVVVVVVVVDVDDVGSFGFHKSSFFDRVVMMVVVVWLLLGVVVVVKVEVIFWVLEDSFFSFFFFLFTSMKYRGWIQIPLEANWKSYPPDNKLACNAKQDDDDDDDDDDNNNDGCCTRKESTDE